MQSFPYFNHAFFIVQTKLRQKSRSHSFAYLRDGEKHIHFRDCFNILVPNEFVLAKFFNYIIQERFIAASDPLLVNHELFAELVCFGGGVSLKTGGLTGENQGLWFVFAFEGVFRDLDLVPCPNTHKCNLIVAVMSFVLFELFLQFRLNFHFGLFFAIVFVTYTFSWFQEVSCLIIVDFL